MPQEADEVFGRHVARADDRAVRDAALRRQLSEPGHALSRDRADDRQLVIGVVAMKQGEAADHPFEVLAPVVASDEDAIGADESVAPRDRGGVASR